MKNRSLAVLFALVLVFAGFSIPTASASPMLVGGFGGTPPAWVDLTAEGMKDWAHYGLITATSFDHKDLVPSQISNYSASGPVARITTGGAVVFDWTDGTPTLAATTDTGVVVGGIGNSFLLKVPADTTPRVLKLYLGVRSAHGGLKVWLSDGSAPAYSDSTLNAGGTAYGEYKFQFAAASPGQVLYVQWTVLNSYGQLKYPGVTLHSATLY